MTVHSNFRKKQKILIIKRNGEQVIARYLDTKSGKIITDKGTFGKDELRSTNIYKPKPSQVEK
ncbi:hypothetical protein [Vibrio owensii]|uniref:hypothetical protein n=1 Tax=Vibrio harveyi group TaxID=717610 RepID=UPI003CC55205